MILGIFNNSIKAWILCYLLFLHKSIRPEKEQEKEMEMDRKRWIISAGRCRAVHPFYAYLMHCQDLLQLQLL